MAIPTDFTFGEQIGNAVIAELNAALPKAWRLGHCPYRKVSRIQFGDLSDYSLVDDETWRSLCPMILVQVLSDAWSVPESFLGGGTGVDYRVAIHHIFHRDQARDLNDLKTMIPPQRAVVQRARVINTAVFRDSTERKLSDPTITATDGRSAFVFGVDYGGTVYDLTGDIGTVPDYFGSTTEITVTTMTQSG